MTRRALASHAVSALSAALIRLCASAFALLAADQAAAVFLTSSRIRLNSPAGICVIPSHGPCVSSPWAMPSASDKRSLIREGRVLWAICNKMNVSRSLPDRPRSDQIASALCGTVLKHVECRTGQGRQASRLSGLTAVPAVRQAGRLSSCGSAGDDLGKFILERSPKSPKCLSAPRRVRRFDLKSLGIKRAAPKSAYLRRDREQLFVP